ncbi:unnamed protein product [Ophioblennius macclurei]
MASPVADAGRCHQSDSAVQEAQTWIEAVTGRCFGDRDFRAGLENGILLCELLSSIKPGLVKKINRLPTPIAGLDNLGAFLRGCEELGLKASQLFDPGDLQDSSTRSTSRGSDCSRKLKNVLATIYWLGCAANSCTSYNGPTLDLKEFEGLLSQMRKEADEAESPKRSIRDSGYIDFWDSERSDSLSPPRHGREDSFDSLDSFGSRSRQTPSPEVLVARGSSDGRGSDSESDGPPHRKMPDIRKDDMLARRTSVTELRTAMPFNQYLPNKSNQSGYVPTPLRKKKNNNKEDGGRKSWSTATSPVGGDRPFRSVSMIDMRGEDEGILLPHSQVRHEMMHNQYNRMREEEDHWQDDLARWKNRRRSISQDLIKKEEERKMMEQLMSRGSCISQRRRSIKTYREIVEDKERREEELRLAYRGARTPEEASAILQRYAQRFSISEAVLERLQLPKLLDRSVSADPAFPCAALTLSVSPITPDPFDTDPDGTLRYLRQQSAPPPKFTSTLEARIDEFTREPPSSSWHHRPQIRSRSSEPPSTRTLSPKAVPLLTPKPYLSRPAAADTSSSKADASLRVNGDIGSDDVAVDLPDSRERRESPPRFQASPSKNAACSGDDPSSSPVAPLPAGSAEENQRGTEETQQNSAAPARPTSLPAELQKPDQSFAVSGRRPSEEGNPNDATQQRPCADAQVEQTETGNLPESVQSGGGAPQHPERVSCTGEISLLGVMSPNSPATSLGRHPNTENPEKDRRGNEKYKREQEKLREEWERAQREVAEEERKFHAAERRILEETVAPLTPRSSALPSPSRAELSTSEPRDAIVRSLADWERKQELLERQTRGSAENVEWKRKENDRTSDISTADDSMKTGRSLMSMSSSQAETAAHSLQNGQKVPPPAAGQGSTPVRTSQEASVDGSSSKSSRPAGERRSVSGKKLCSSCGQPLGKGAAMIIETLSLYFHIHCFKCGVCKGQLGDTTTGTDVRIRNGLLNCHQCYIRSRSAGQPTTL